MLKLLHLCTVLLLLPALRNAAQACYVPGLDEAMMTGQYDGLFNEAASIPIEEEDKISIPVWTKRAAYDGLLCTDIFFLH